MSRYGWIDTPAPVKRTVLRDRQGRCSFCGKLAVDVLALVIGPRASICDACAILVLRIDYEAAEAKFSQAKTKSREADRELLETYVK